MTKSNVDSQNPFEYAGTNLSQVPLMGQKPYPSYPLRRNGNRDSRDPLGNGRYYAHSSGSGCGGHHGTPYDGDGGSPDNSMEVA